MEVKTFKTIMKNILMCHNENWDDEHWEWPFQFGSGFRKIDYYKDLYIRMEMYSKSSTKSSKKT